VDITYQAAIGWASSGLFLLFSVETPFYVFELGLEIPIVRFKTFKESPWQFNYLCTRLLLVLRWQVLPNVFTQNKYMFAMVIELGLID
jgi:hypothetical protein